MSKKKNQPVDEVLPEVKTAAPVEETEEGAFTVRVKTTQPAGPRSGFVRTFKNKKDAKAFADRFDGEFI